MKEFKGTPGPWTMFEVAEGIGVTTAHADVAHCMGFDENRRISEERANATLMAAAPDLLSALQAFVATLDKLLPPEGQGALYRDAVTAIQKALEVQS